MSKVGRPRSPGVAQAPVFGREMELADTFRETPSGPDQHRAVVKPPESASRSISPATKYASAEETISRSRSVLAPGMVSASRSADRWRHDGDGDEDKEEVKMDMKIMNK